VRDLVGHARPRVIYHLAAQIDVRRSVTDPRFDIDVNACGTIELLEAARATGTTRFVFASTGGAIYGEGEGRPLPLDESAECLPDAPYGQSKLAAEGYVGLYERLYGMSTVALRLGNVYGPRQSPHGEAGVVSIFSRLLWEGRAPKLFGYGDATRDYVHVYDVVSCLRAASGTRGVFNVATAVETSVREVFEILRDEAGVDVEPELLPLREGELTRSCMDPANARETLGWSAQVPFERGMRETYRELIAEFEAEVPSCR
jgi:UDP-glucose 4-epimerase